MLQQWWPTLTIRKYDKGFLIVATLNTWYKNSALALIDNLDEFYPEAKIFVATHKAWADEFENLDNVVKVLTEDDGMPSSTRTKLWALRYTPFIKTCYLDADMEVISDEIQEVWDILDNNHDMAFTVINPKCGSTTAIYKEDGEAGIRDNDPERHLRYHGGFFLWNNTELANKAMELWWDRYQEINCSKQWWEDHPEIYHVNKSWDQFTLWWILKYDTPGIKIQEYTQAKWNWNLYMPKEDFVEGEQVIIHHPLDRTKMQEQGINIAKFDEVDEHKIGPGGIRYADE